MPILEVRSLRKSYGDVQALKGVDFAAEEGQLFALLGPNGAGKSTTIDICCTLLKGDGGTVMVDGLALGKDDDAIRSRIGVVFQQTVLDDRLTVRENLLTRGSFYGLRGAALKQAAQQAGEYADVMEFWNRQYGKLSGGQRRRADIARALVTTPKLLFLDEPTTGLDPQTRRAVWDTIRRLQGERGMTVFLTTHYMDEAALADYIVVIDHGEVAAQGTPGELYARYTADQLILEALPEEREALAQCLREKGYAPQMEGNTLCVKLGNTLESIDLLPLCRGKITQAQLRHGTMDDVFLAITGKELRE